MTEATQTTIELGPRDGVEMRQRVRVLERPASGPPRHTAVFLHGISSWAGTWAPLLPRLPQDVRAIAYDALASAYTEHDGPRRPLTIEDWRDQLLALMGKLGAGRAVLVGHSLGCRTAAAAALEAPERVSGLVLEGPALLPKRLSGLQRALVAPGVRNVMILVSPLGARVAAGPALRSVAPSAQFSPALLRQEVGHAQDRPRAVFRGYSDLLLGMQLERPWEGEKHLAEIEAPVLILRGEGDEEWMPVEHEQRYRELMPDAVIERWEGVGHSPHIEVPDRYLERLDRFLDSI